ncbi:MAG: cystathionine gamma-synthase [Flavobacteriales bacterium]|nr:cystathionine gamma-synthase [Flavobacteriales bacterium]
MKFGTKVIHAAIEPDSATGAIMTPIYQTSTFVQTAPGEHKGYEYSRSQNPTRHTLEKNLAALENAKHGLCFASGMAATDAIIKLLSPGDEVISTNDLYGGSYRIFETIFKNYGIVFHFVPMNDTAAIKEKLNDNTKMIWVETPTNPMMNIIDIKAVSEISKSKDLILVVDNTFASPYLQNPMDLGADIIIHSITKYIGGHSDVIMGAAICNNDNLQERLAFIQNTCGAVPGPQDSFLVLRGIKTLHLRMQRHCENTEKMANHLRNHDKVEKVFWPGFEDHPNHSIAKEQMSGFGGNLSFIIRGNKMEDAYTFLSSVRVFTLAESLGGVESLCSHPASMTHAAIPKEIRERSGVVDSLIRFSVGVEDIEDLIVDIDQALSKI